MGMMYSKSTSKKNICFTDKSFTQTLHWLMFMSHFIELFVKLNNFMMDFLILRLKSEEQIKQ